MATRSQTALFRKYREALRSVRPYAASSSRHGGAIELVEAPLLKGGPQGYNAIGSEDLDARHLSAGSSTMNLPPGWVDISDQVSADMQRARTKMAELAKAHSRALMPSFDETSKEEHTIELLSQEITKLLKKCEQKLQQLSRPSGPSEQDANIRKNVQRSLATDLQTLFMDFRKQQKGYLNKLQRQQEGQAVDDGIGLRKQPKTSEDDDFSESFTNQHLQQLRQNEALSIEREKEISQIVESVQDLAQIMKDLSVLVIDQGTIVDRIDYNIMNVASSVEQGVKELVKAEETQKRGGMVTCILVLIVLCAAMLIIFVLKKIIGL